MADVISVEKMEKILTEIEKRECDSPQEEIHRIRAIGDIRHEIYQELICQHEQRQALMDGKHPNYSVVADKHGRALKHNPIPVQDRYDAGFIGNAWH